MSNNDTDPVDPDDDSTDEDHYEYYKTLFFLVLLGLLFIKFLAEAYFEKKKPKFGHNTGIVIFLGMAVSFCMFKFVGNKNIMHDCQFNQDAFFYLILPTIMFPSGYNMRRKKFFANISTILKFGVFATLICYAFYVSGMYSLHHAGFLTKWDPLSDKYV